jgi:hypothetical protein
LRECRSLDTIAAAYAEAGNFDKAVEFEQKASETVTDEAKKAEYRKRLDLYRNKKPYRDSKK